MTHYKKEFGQIFDVNQDEIVTKISENKLMKCNPRVPNGIFETPTTVSPHSTILETK